MIKFHELSDYIEQTINFKNPLLWLLCLHILFNVFYWNITSMIQYKTKIFTKLFGDSKKAVYIHMIVVFSFGLSRDNLYRYVVNTSNNFLPLIDNQFITYLGYLMLLMGNILVLSATYKLGMIGTFNGDAYGFLLPAIITSFPFNLFNAPMYLGSTLNFLGYAVIKRSATGVFLTTLIGFAYFCGNIFEE